MSRDFNPIAAHDGEYVPFCPKCGIEECGHTPEEMYLFALDAIADAARWYDEMCIKEPNESAPTQDSVD